MFFIFPVFYLVNKKTRLPVLGQGKRDTPFWLLSALLALTTKM
jgi:hypothetical protein